MPYPLRDPDRAGMHGSVLGSAYPQTQAFIGDASQLHSGSQTSTASHHLYSTLYDEAVLLALADHTEEMQRIYQAGGDITEHMSQRHVLHMDYTKYFAILEARAAAGDRHDPGTLLQIIALEEGSNSVEGAASDAGPEPEQDGYWDTPSSEGGSPKRSPVMRLEPIPEIPEEISRSTLTSPQDAQDDVEDRWAYYAPSPNPRRGHTPGFDPQHDNACRQPHELGAGEQMSGH
ncbi:hypothetical protein C8Q77DRAFT_1235687 [Trametes polyzona]|nr:hypothetical protein C8Q77DRAFT_1235687 [Trametes polyzona]